MQGQLSDAVYFMRRARDEAHLALMAVSPEIAAAHHGLAVQYTMRSCQARQAAEAREQSAFSQLEGPKLDVLSTRHVRQRIGLHTG